jgi:CelD/BcsL family acetyltransferase involved in cellulose biosynthesis
MMNDAPTSELILLTSLEDMARLESQWRALDARSTADFVWFQSFEWCFKWMLHHGSAKCTPHILVILEKGEATAILPLMCKKTGFAVKSLRVLGEPHSQYGNLLTVNGQLSSEHRELLLKGLQTVGKIDQLMLPLVPENAPLEQLLPARGRMPSLSNASTQLRLKDYADTAAYEATLGKKTGRNLRRAVNQFQQQGELTFTVMRSSDAGFRDIVNQCLAMKAQWLSATGRSTDAIEEKGHRRFLGDLHGDPQSGERQACGH